MKETQKSQKNKDNTIVEETNQKNNGPNLLQDRTLLKPGLFDFIPDAQLETQTETDRLDLNQQDNVLEINNWNCKNYESAKKAMCRYLFIFFAQGKDMMFDANMYARNSLVNYERDQDGLSFLHSLIKDHHTDLCSTIHRANITDAYTLPKFNDDMSIWKYSNMMQIYFKEVNTQATQVDSLCLIHDQLRWDLQFTKATEHLQVRISENKTGNGSVPEEYSLKAIAKIIMDLYDPLEQGKLSEPCHPSCPGANAMQINQMRTLSQRQVHNDRTYDETSAH